MYEHHCSECQKIWFDREYDSLCPNCWCGKYTTEYVD